MQVEGFENAGLDREHFVEDRCRCGVGRGCPSEHLDFGKLVDAVEAFRIHASSACFGAVAPANCYALHRELRLFHSNARFHSREGNLRRCSEAELGLTAAGITGGLRKVVGLLFAVLVARLETTGIGDVAVDDARRADYLPASRHGGAERVLDEGLLEERGFVEEIVPPPAGGCGCAGKVKEGQLGADLDV